MAYPMVKAQLNGVPYKAIAVGVDTYLIWTVAKDTKVNLTKVVYGDVEIDGKKPSQVVDGSDTYILWSDIPGITPHPLNGGGFNFTTADQSITHNYTMVVTEADTEVAGMWAYIFVQTLDNGKPVKGTGITINENGSPLVTNAATGDAGESFMWGISESTNKTDTIVVTWTDPLGQLHTVTKQTKFEIPVPTDTPVPSDDSTVVVVPMLPSSDPMDAVYFNVTAPNNQVVQVQLDTGAFELMFTKDTAATLGLAKEMAVTVTGVGGQSQAYYSHATFTINGVEFKDVPCVIDEGFTGYPLFGYKFFIDNGYDLLVSQKHNTITILK